MTDELLYVVIAAACLIAFVAFLAAGATILRVHHNDPDAWKKGRVFGLAILAGEFGAIHFLRAELEQQKDLFRVDPATLAAALFVGVLVALAYPVVGIAAIKTSERLQKFAVPGQLPIWPKPLLLALLPFWPIVLAYWVVMTPLLAVVERVGGDDGDDG